MYTFGSGTEWLGLAPSLLDHSVSEGAMYLSLCAISTFGLQLFIQRITMNFPKVTRYSFYALFTLLLALLIGLVFFGRYYAGKVLSSHTSTNTDKESALSAFDSLKKPQAGKPIKLIIPSQNVELSVVAVSRSEDGVMETPKSWNLAGWYKGSSKTLEEGNIIINGHYDDNYGRPAAFWKLKNLRLDDTVRIVDEFNRPVDYKVTSTYYIAIDDPDRFKVYDSEEGKQSLTLITCGGVWLPGESTYNKRLIIKADRID